MTHGGTLFAAYYNAHRSRLPAGYREVEYIESTGVQWIDTGVALDGSLSADIEYSVISYTGSGNIALYGAVQAQNGFFSGVSNGTYYINNTNIPAIGISFALRTRYHDTTAGVVYEHNGNQYTIPQQSSLDSTCILFGRRNGASVERIGTLDVFGFSLSAGYKKTRNYIPCVRLSDSKPGMYDLCGSICPLTGTPFYINAGTGADFTWGELS